MKIFEGAWAILLMFILIFVLMVFIERTQNKDFYKKCREDFNSNPYSFDKENIDSISQLAPAK